MQHCFINRIRRLVWKDASRQKADQLFYLVNSAAFHDIVIDKNIFSKEFDLLCHVGKETTNFGGQMYDMGRLVLFKDGFRCLAVSQVSIFAG